MHASAQRICDEAQIELPGCPRPLVAMALRETVMGFLDRSKVLVVGLDPMDVEAGTGEYPLTVPEGWSGYRIDVPLAVVLDGRRLRERADWYMADATTLALREAPTADAEGALQVTAAMQIDDIATASLDGLRTWQAAIAAGLKSRLMFMPGKPWTSLPMAEFYRREYNRGLSEAMSWAATCGLAAPVRIGV